MEHVSTQIPYAVLVAVCAGLGYLVAGISGGSLVLSMGTAFVALVAATVTLHMLGNKKREYQADISTH